MKLQQAATLTTPPSHVLPNPDCTILNGRFTSANSNQTAPVRNTLRQHRLTPDNARQNSPCAVYLVDANRKVLFHNGVDVLNYPNSGLFEISPAGTLVCRQGTLQHRLDRLLTELTNNKPIPDNRAELITIPAETSYRTRNSSHSSQPTKPVHLSVQRVSGLFSNHHRIAPPPESKSASSICFFISIFSPAVNKKYLVDHAADLFKLSGAEKEILTHITEGLDNKAIAKYRNVSPDTVKKQVLSMLVKADCSNRTMLVGKVFSLVDEFSAETRMHHETYTPFSLPVVPENSFRNF